MTRRRVALGAVVLAAAAAAALAATLGGRSPAAPAPQRGIGVVARIAPRAALFGDTLQARVDVLVDRRAVDPASVKLVADYGRYAPVAAPDVARSIAGKLTRLVYVTRLQCLTLECFDGSRRSVEFPPARLEFTRVDGGAGSLALDWLPVEVSSRMSPADFELLSPIDQPPFHASTTLPALTYRLPPTLLVVLLAVLGGALLAAAGVVAVRVLPERVEAAAAPRRAPAPVAILPTLSPLERALQMLEHARERGVIPEQRKALENLAGELRRSGERELGRTATVLAWAERPPPGDATRALAAAVHRRIAKVNGHRADA